MSSSNSSNCECKDENPLWVDIIAYIGGAILGFAPWQQLWKAIKTKKTRDVSLKACLCIVLGLSMSITFTSYNKILPILIPTTIEMLAWVMLVLFKICWSSNTNTNTTPEFTEIHLSEHEQDLEKSLHSLTALKGSIKTNYSITDTPTTDTPTTDTSITDKHTDNPITPIEIINVAQNESHSTFQITV
jgi:uncharacterized protein with PQ loop repeat